MKRCLTVACLLMLVASSVAGAATKGSKELIFGFSGLNSLDLGTFDGGIAIRHYISDNTAVRPGVELGFSSQKTDGVGGATDDKTTNNNFGVNIAIEKHMGGSKNVSPYCGLGAGVSFGSTKLEPSHAAAPATGTLLSSTDSGTNFGVFGLCGFQWSFAEGVTLGGEYQLGLSAGSSKTEDVRQATATSTFKGSGFGLGLSTASLSISVAM